jgi:hypothetical protein
MQLEVRVVQQVLDVGARAGVEVVDADDVVALGHQPFAQVAAQEAGAAGDEDLAASVVLAHAMELPGVCRWRAMCRSL